MGNFRDRAREIKARGVAERGNWQPKEGSVPLSMYRYWAENTTADVPKSENFCHYWRVVGLWAPLLWVLNKVYDFVSEPLGQIILAVVYLVAVASLWQFAGAAGVAVGMLAGPYIAAGIFAGLVVGVDKVRSPVMIALAVVTLPVSGVFIAAAAVYHWWPKWMTTWTLRVLIGVAAVIAAYLAYLLATEATLRGFLLGIGILVAFVAVAAGIVYSVTYIEGRRELKKEAEREAYYNSLHDGTYVDTPPKSPGRVSRFFSGIGDLLIFVAQVVRVKKWKICPMVQIPGDKQL